LAGAAPYTVILDANVLYPALLRDVLLTLAHADIYNAKWTATIEQELTRALLRDFPDKANLVEQLAQRMREAVPDCLVTGYEPLVDSLQLPDADDRHVLAAAVVGHADAIVTFNRKDFPPEVCSPFSVEVQSADEFLVNQITLQKLPALAAIRRMRERWERPEVTAAELIDLLAIRGLGMTAACLADAVDLL
jgi:predicted nucleic acid-binding protein